MSAFAKDVLQTVVAAALGSATSALIQRGQAGAQGSADYVDLALGGLQTGVDFVAYPVALNLLGKVSPAFKKNLENPKGKKYVTWVLGGATTALLGSLLKYPLQVAQQSRKGEKKACNPKDILSNTIDSIGGSIGFPATNDTFTPLIPEQSNAFASWARGHVLVHIANLGSTLFAFPLARLRHGAKLGDMIAGWARGIPGTMYLNDACGHFKALMQ